MPLAFKPTLTAADYLAGEQASDFRHEFVDSQVYAMRRVELYHRAPDGSWAAAVVEAGDIDLECVHASLSLDEIYEDVKFMTNEPLAFMDKA